MTVCGTSCRLMKFQSTLPRGERRKGVALGCATINFNPRSREGSDAGQRKDVFTPIDFNPRSREGSDCRYVLQPPIKNNFNPRSREGSDGTTRLMHISSRISIHAPARGATNCGLTDYQVRHYFNPRSPGGSDLFRHGMEVNHINFNPRSREGSDDFFLFRFSHKVFISIHAPARGATSPFCLPAKITRFQSTLPRGERLVGGSGFSSIASFQSTLPRGERPAVIRGLIRQAMRFQSTLPRGERQDRQKY